MAKTSVASTSNTLGPWKPQSAFSIALEEFVNQPTKKKRPAFIQKVLDGKNTTPEAVNDEVRQWEQKNSQRASRRVIWPVFQAILDYDGVIGVLCQADPYPSALIWGGLKAVLECFSRYNEVFKLLEGHLGALTQQIRLFKHYEELFAHSEDMLNLLISSYKHIISFWARVEEQCTTPGFMLVVKSLSSFTLRKLETIVGDIAANGTEMEKLVPVIQERLRRQETEDAGRERTQAGLTLTWIRDRMAEDRELMKRNMTAQWIAAGNPSMLNESNYRRQYRRAQDRLTGTGGWLYDDHHFRHWMDAESRSNVLWLRGAPGVGKSMICSQAIQELEQLRPEAAVAFHLFSFDEEESRVQVYRNLAGQLFFAIYNETDEVSDTLLEIVHCLHTIPTLQNMIRALIAETNTTFIFLDGLDEECRNRDRWDAASEVISFLLECAKAADSPLKLWCSSQDNHKIRNLLKGCEEIQLGAATNSKDIEAFFQTAFTSQDFEEVDDAAKTKMLRDLNKQVNGNFLWASLMLDTLKDAPDGLKMKEIVDKGVPENFERYLETRIRTFPAGNHSFISKLLSCLVYAKRPLHIEELCEAITIANTNDGENLDANCRVFRSRVLDSCAPLIRIDDVPSGNGWKHLCALSHGSVKVFLMDNPNVLSEKIDSRISAGTLAYTCMKYLMQPRYSDLFRKGDKALVTKCGSNIMNHDFLVYAAKYWNKHLDDLEYSEEIGKSVKKFIKSKNFMTCLQVQSLFVGGKFDFWHSQFDLSRRTQLVRAFPRWFTKQHPGGDELQRQYHVAVGEWGHFLADESSHNGKFRGRIDRCFWPSLGKSNFLHKIPSVFKTFTFEDSDEGVDRSVLYFSRVGLDGTQVDIFKLRTSDEPDSEAEVIVERWGIARGRSPKLSGTQTIRLPASTLRLYQKELKKPLPDKAEILEATRDGTVLRIGCQFYVGKAGTEPSYQHVNLRDDVPEYMEEIASNSKFFAMASRNKVTEDELKEDPVPVAVAEAKVGSQDTSPGSDSSSSTDSSSESDSDSSSSDRDGNEAEPAKPSPDKGEDAPAEPAAPSEAGSLDVQSRISDREGYEVDWSDTDSIDCQSARESWSEGSTDPSPETDERLLNESESEEEAVEDEAFIDGSVSSVSDALEKLSISDSSVGSIKSLDLAAEGSFGNASSDAGLENPVSLSSSDEHTSHSSSEDEEVQMARKKIEDLLSGGQQKGVRGPPCEIRVFRVDGDGSQREQVFRYRQRVSRRLYNSPPVLHPTEDLLVWPLGNTEILFAHFTENTCFTRLMSKCQPNSCQISVQCSFSPCGHYLHMASLESIKIRYTDGEKRMGLKLLVTTHRLSVRKLARSPPDMIYRTSILLEMQLADGDKLDVKNLPMTLTWTKDYLYVSETRVRLSVSRIPLFRAVEDRDQSSSSLRGIVRNMGDVFLPRSSYVRKTHFFPAGEDAEDAPAKESKKSKSGKSSKSDKYVAHILLEALNASGKPQGVKGDRGEIFFERTAPQGVHLTDEQLGGFDSEVGHIMRAVQRSETWRGGELLAKFEKFDTSEDCDIVPYLHY